MKRFTLAFLAVFLCFYSRAQIGGSSAYSFLNLSTPSRIAALGGTFISVSDDDPNPATMNPSLLNPSMDKMLSFSGVKYYADVSGGDVSYTKSFEKAGTFQAAMHYINYGTFTSADIYGNVNGSFTAADNALQIGWGYPANKYFSIGADVKMIYSHLEEYTSYGLAGDFGVSYASEPRRGISMSLLARNFGSEIKQYNENDERETVKPEVMFGFSKKFPHAPFRIVFTYRHLEQFDYAYLNPVTAVTIDPLSGEKTITEINFWDKISRHIILGTELVFSKNFSLMYAYNFQRRAESKLQDKGGVTGMSFGFGLQISRFRIGFGMAQYHEVGMSKHLTITLSPSDFFRKKKAAEVQPESLPDRDGDGIEDRIDHCPDVAGLLKFNGCPDTDNDGVMDSEDACPTDSGAVANKGCPVVEKAPVEVPLTTEEKEIIKKVFDNLEFETGEAIIQPSSFASLNELADLLKQKTTYKLNIDGHTDNVGDPSYNQQLSENRAKAVKKYLTDKEIDSSRITAKGYGSTHPIADNNTPEGRQRNRRVEFTIVE